MSKAILVMNMPSGCINCKLYDYPPSRCFVNGRFQNDISEDYKPEWCPLQKLPEKQEDLPTNIYRDGWNACIDTILKGGE